MRTLGNRRTRAVCQEKAMIEQFSEAKAESSEQRDWQRIRRAATGRMFKRRSR